MEISTQSRASEDMRCPYCHDEVPEDQKEKCEDCGTVHHEECMDEFFGCTLLGCENEGCSPKQLEAEEWASINALDRCIRRLDEMLRGMNIAILVMLIILLVMVVYMRPILL